MPPCRTWRRDSIASLSTCRSLLYCLGVKLPRQVLVVEDDAAVRGVLTTVLNRNGYQVESADSAEAAVAFLDHAFDAIVSDWQMGEHDGVWLLEQVRRRNPETVRVLISGGGPGEVSVGPANAVQHYLPKPLELARLLRTLAGPKPSESSAAPGGAGGS